MKKIILLALLLLLPTISAQVNDTTYVQVTVENNQIKLNGIVETNVVGIGRINVSTNFVSLNDTLTLTTNCTSVDINGTNHTTCSSTYSSYTKTVPLNFANTISLTTTESDTQVTLNRCLEERGNWLGAFTACEATRVKLEGIDSNYSICQTSLASCNSERGVLQSENSNLKTEQEDNKNKPITGGVIGAILGAVAAGVYFGKIGGQKHRNPDDDYNRRQAA